ncbi:MAG TPA: class I SAM-dependent methyltransferase [Gemmatimonadales bacterium]|jgi:predicted O-methyltransferase YrrM|nr:class I SAM-dependent methyltransferase [Gemmatimonadales bacterium]
MVAPKRSLLPDAVEEYVSHLITRETPLQRSLRRETATLPEAGMQIGADQGALLALLVRVLGARHVLEIGTFTGYSAMAMAAALPEDGRLLTCDVSEEWTGIARRFWEAAGLANKIELRLGPAQETLERLFLEWGPRSFDLAFIDADKPAYDAYYEACLQLIRPGGIIALDNMLWSGAVADLTNQEPNPAAIRALNLKIRDDPRVDACLLTIGDGLMLASPRSNG